MCDPDARDPAGARNRIRIAPGGEGIERLEAHLYGRAFAPHRHDTYAIGITLAGVQAFRFRGAQWQCLPGQCHILHPDEVHDGRAATEAGFAYRIVYVDPAQVAQALGGGPLPFVADPILSPACLTAEDAATIWDFGAEMDEFAGAGLVGAVAGLLARMASVRRRAGPLALDRLARVRDRIAGYPARIWAMDELEEASGLDRWTLARQFRAAFGTSPSRFRTMRRLALVRRRLQAGAPLADAAAEAGFADQSHMSRHFKSAYGLTPGAWVSAVTAARRQDAQGTRTVPAWLERIA